MNSNMEFVSLKHLTEFSFYHDANQYTVGGNRYNAYRDVETLLVILSGSTDKAQMVESLPLAQEKISGSTLPPKEKAEWSSYLVAYVNRLGDASLIARARELMGLGKEMLGAVPGGILWGVVKPLIPVIVIGGVILISVLIFVPKIKTPMFQIEGRNK